MSEAYDPDNLLDRISAPATLEVAYRHLEARERELLGRHLPLPGGDVLSVGAGWHPGRHLFPAPAFRLVAVDVDGDRVRIATETGRADGGAVATAEDLPFPDDSFDVVLQRLVLHHVAYRGSLEACFREAARVLRPRGALVAIEPGRRHPIGLALSLANAVGLGRRMHGTPDDVPLAPGRLRALAHNAGLEPELFSLTYSWRRLPPRLQRALWRLDRYGEGPLRAAGHTLMLIARKPPD